MVRTLYFADPCVASWESMTGSTARRLCDRCEKQVHSLSDMTPKEAERLLAEAPPGTLCVRVEHDGEEVRFRGQASGGRPAGRALPMLRVAMTASLLVAACDRADPGATPEPLAATPAATVVEAAVTPPASATLPSAAPSSAAPTACDPEAQGSLPIPVDAPRAVDGKTLQKQDRRVTMGCVCAPQDALCDCL